MKITREQLLESDYDTLFTHDPGTFIEIIIINLLWAEKGKNEAEVIERQRFVFEKWLQYYSDNLRQDIVAELGSDKNEAANTYQNGFIAGQIHALTSLPMKKSLLTQYVDLIAVAETLRQLKVLSEEKK
jgi:hypothetical protein